MSLTNRMRIRSVDHFVSRETLNHLHYFLPQQSIGFILQPQPSPPQLLQDQDQDQDQDYKEDEKDSHPIIEAIIQACGYMAHVADNIDNLRGELIRIQEMKRNFPKKMCQKKYNLASIFEMVDNLHEQLTLLSQHALRDSLRLVFEQYIWLQDHPQKVDREEWIRSWRDEKNIPPPARAKKTSPSVCIVCCINIADVTFSTCECPSTCCSVCAMVNFFTYTESGLKSRAPCATCRTGYDIQSLVPTRDSFAHYMKKKMQKSHNIIIDPLFQKRTSVKCSLCDKAFASATICSDCLPGAHQCEECMLTLLWNSWFKRTPNECKCKAQTPYVYEKIEAPESTSSLTETPSHTTTSISKRSNLKRKHSKKPM